MGWPVAVLMCVLLLMMSIQRTERVVFKEVCQRGLGRVDVVIGLDGPVVVKDELTVQGVEVHQHRCTCKSSGVFICVLNNKQIISVEMRKKHDTEYDESS